MAVVAVSTATAAFVWVPHSPQEQGAGGRVGGVVGGVTG